MRKWLLLFVGLVFVLTTTSTGKAQDNDQDYVLYYMTQDRETYRYQLLMRSEFDEGDTPADGNPVFDFSNAELSSVPAISPDGETIIFTTERPFFLESGYAPDQIHAISPLGEDFRNITEADRKYEGLSWSPDGKRIAVFARPAEFDSTTHLEIIDIEGNTILSIEEPGQYLGLDWTQNGAKLAMLDAYGLEGRLLIVDTESGEVTISDEPFFGWIGAPQVNWSADESYIFFTGSFSDPRHPDNDPYWEVLQYEVASGEISMFLETTTVSAEPVVLSPDGSQFAIMDGSDDGYQLVVVDVDSHDTVQSIDVSLLISYFYGPVAWSPDGAYIAFSMKEDVREPARIYLLDVASGELTRVTSNSDVNAVFPQWLPQQ